MKYIVKESFKPLCCGNCFETGQILEVVRQTSKNRLSINAYELHKQKLILRGTHNVKCSTFYRCCEIKKE